jgi:hypothetical protein
MVEPKLAVPDSVGSEVAVGGWLVTNVVTDQMSVVSESVVLVVLAVTKLPASASTWEYVVEFAPVISAQWSGSSDATELTALEHLYHW